jgi:hypothetical protein
MVVKRQQDAAPKRSATASAISKPQPAAKPQQPAARPQQQAAKPHQQAARPQPQAAKPPPQAAKPPPQAVKPTMKPPSMPSERQTDDLFAGLGCRASTRNVTTGHFSKQGAVYPSASPGARMF